MNSESDAATTDSSSAASAKSRMSRLKPETRMQLSAQGIKARAVEPAVMARPRNQNAVKRLRLYSISKGHEHVNERIRRLARAVIRELGLDPTKDAAIVRAWARSEILSTEAFSFVLAELAKGELTGKILDQWRMTTQLELQLAKEIGMTPTSRVALGLDVQRGRTLNAAEQIAQERLRRMDAAVEVGADD